MKNSLIKFLEIKGEWLKLKVPMQDLWEFSPFFSFSLGEEFWRRDPTIRRPCGYCLRLDTWTVWRTLSRETYKYVFSYILKDTIFCSWCLNILNIRFNVFRCIRCFDWNLRKNIDVRTQKLDACSNAHFLNQCNTMLLSWHLSWLWFYFLNKKQFNWHFFHIVLEEDIIRQKYELKGT